MRFLFTAGLVLLIVSSQAQTGSISGKITDSSGKKVLPLTTITVFIAKDTTIVTYRLSTETGEFKIPNLPINVPLRMMATYSGYEAYRKDFTLEATNPAINFGSIALVNTSKQLDEVIVIAERPPVVIKQDTIEFNASAFKTLPSALLEDLLKKLPGVMVDENGNITVNGRIVNRLLVDGKRFFGDDPKMATRNLPSNLIDKIQVMDDKDEMALNNDGDMSKIGKVLNITLKKSVKKAVFGRAFAGAGTDERYEAGAIVNSFRDTLQMSLIGFANNINRSSFSTRDITTLGGFSRSGWGTINGNGNSAGQQGFTVDGFSLGGTGQGLNRANGIGFNLNHSPTKAINFSFQYMYGTTHNDLEQVQNTQRYFGDTIVNTRTNTTATSNGTTHNVSVSGGWKPDTLNNTTLRVAYAYSDNNSHAPSFLSTDNSKLGTLNTGTGTLLTKSQTDYYSHVLNYTHRFKNRPGQVLSAIQVLNRNENPASAVTESFNNYLYPTNSNVLFQQLRSTSSPSTNFYQYINYSAPLGKRLTLRLNPYFTYQKNEQAILTFGKTAATGKYDSANLSLGSGLTREMSRWSTAAILSYKIGNVTVNAGGAWLQQWINNGFTNKLLSNHRYYSNLLANISINYKKISLGFSQEVNPPSINYMIPVPDNSNPFYVNTGNPDLRPSRRNIINLNGNYYHTKTSTNLYFSGQTFFTDDAVIQSVYLSSNGVQTNTPINVNGAWSSYLDAGVSRQFKNQQKLNITVSAGPTFNFIRTPVVFNAEKSSLTTISSGINTGLALNYRDIIELNPKYNITVNQSHYTSSAFTNRNITTQVLQGDFIVRLPKKIVWETNLYYRLLNEVAPGLPKTSVYWNAAVTVLMFKEDKGQLRFAVYDILNSNTNVYRYFSGNAIVDNRTNVLQRYYMITYTYNIRSFGNQTQKVGGRSNLFNF